MNNEKRSIVKSHQWFLSNENGPFRLPCVSIRKEYRCSRKEERRYFIKCYWNQYNCKVCYNVTRRCNYYKPTDLYNLVLITFKIYKSTVQYTFCFPFSIQSGCKSVDGEVTSNPPDYQRPYTSIRSFLLSFSTVEYNGSLFSPLRTFR